MVSVKVPGAPQSLPFNDTLGQTIPADTPHAISVSLPTWRSNVGYEEGEEWVVEKMQTGYPRFFIHKSIQRLASSIVAVHGNPETDLAMLLPTKQSALRCKSFLEQQSPDVDGATIRHLDFASQTRRITSDPGRIMPQVSAVIYPKDLWPAAKAFWQHTGEGIQSRRAEFCQKAFDDKSLVEASTLTPPQTPRMTKGPKRYQRPTSVDLGNPNGHVSNGANGTNGTNGANEANNTNGHETIKSGDVDSAQFVEERFGRNLSPKFAAQAKLAIRKRIAGSLTTNTDLPESLNETADVPTQRNLDVPAFTVDDVYLFSCSMNAIFTSHRILRLARGEMKSIMYGFPYVDTLKILEKFGAGAVFFGHANSKDIDDLEKRLEAGERFLSLYCEFPGNPLLKSPDLKRLRKLADKYEFAIVIDETIGNFLNTHVLPFADIVVSSLSKIFSGDSNVMGGALILNPHSKWYADLKEVLLTEFEDSQFEEDSVCLERNSRDFVDRIRRVNINAEAVADTLRASPKTKEVMYPKYSPTREFYDACRLPDGGYGGLLSATFHSVEDTAIFYDHLNTDKGPSLGTNFTLSSPFVLLAHYGELEWAAQYGCEASLIRFSVGLEDTGVLVQRFQAALDAVPSRS